MQADLPGRIGRVVGIDFSGAKLAGLNTWVAECRVLPDGTLKLEKLQSLHRRLKQADRRPALAALSAWVAGTDADDHPAAATLFAIDFPFGLPVELFPAGTAWPGQLAFAAGFPDARSLGLACCDIAEGKGFGKHVRRATDKASKTPFDCYHYRIVYQTYHGMLDVLRPAAAVPGVAVLPFMYAALPAARRVVVEACPSSTLKRLGLPHQRYKQPAAPEPDAAARAVRQTILRGLKPFVNISPGQRKVMLQNPGGDAMDAVIAAVGGWAGFCRTDHPALANDDRHPREGYVFM
ncbi:MAG: DUF429 domain-containing protein [Phycisphaerae bacterium]